MNDIKVSVVIPVYRTPLEYLRACLDSLVAQTMQECEFIVVSDGAPEAECSICEEYAARDCRIKFFRREHAGVSATRNYGMAQALGKYISFVDSDDWIDANILDCLGRTKIGHFTQIKDIMMELAVLNQLFLQIALAWLLEIDIQLEIP